VVLKLLEAELHLPYPSKELSIASSEEMCSTDYLRETRFPREQCREPFIGCFWLSSAYTHCHRNSSDPTPIAIHIHRVTK
jgi:hypothetical protein